MLQRLRKELQDELDRLRVSISMAVMPLEDYARNVGHCQTLERSIARIDELLRLERNDDADD